MPDYLHEWSVDAPEISYKLWLERKLSEARQDTERLNKLDEVAWPGAVRRLAQTREDHDNIRSAIDDFYKLKPAGNGGAK